MQMNHFIDEVAPMQFRELKNLAASTGDAAFVVDGEGNIAALNSAAIEMLGIREEDAKGKPCSIVLCGEDACGHRCSPLCSVRQAADTNRQIKNYDLKVKTPQGRMWCNISVLLAEVATSTRPYSIHIIRPNDIQKRLELVMMDFIVRESNLGEEEVRSVASLTRSPARETALSGRELEILQMLAAGISGAGISQRLGISRTTVNNHIQHILQKMNVHTRLEAIRLAEQSRLI